jgi:hypothetical protein
MASGPTNLADLTAHGVLSGAAARERTLPLLAAFAALVPQAALQRGSVVACDGPAAVTLALALAAGPSQQGAWVGVVGLSSVGLAAAGELGVVLQRLVAVVEPLPTAAAADPAAPTAGPAAVAGRFDDERWGDVLAAMVDGFDVLLLGPGAQQVRPATARRVLARAQARGAVVLTVGAPVFGADLRFEATGATWIGLGAGHGVAQGRRAVVQLSGRRVPRQRLAELWLPDAAGQVQPAVLDPRPAVLDPRPAVLDPRPVVLDPRPAVPVPLRRTG